MDAGFGRWTRELPSGNLLWHLYMHKQYEESSIEGIGIYNRGIAEPRENKHSKSMACGQTIITF
jgi:hypothetical protein